MFYVTHDLRLDWIKGTVGLGEKMHSTECYHDFLDFWFLQDWQVILGQTDFLSALINQWCKNYWEVLLKQK